MWSHGPPFWNSLLLELTAVSTPYQFNYKGVQRRNQEFKLGGAQLFWGKAHPPLVSSAFHSPPSSCTRCFPTTLNMSSLPLTLERVVWGSPCNFFGPGSSPGIFLNVYIALGEF